jgi:hypothetical protein
MFALLAQAYAATWNVPQDFPTLGAAEAGAAAGDTITIDPGAYSEHVHVTKDLVFEGQPGVTWTGAGVDEPLVCEGVACTVREVAFAPNGTRAIFAQAGAELVVEDCTLVNGSGTNGGAIRASNAASLVVRRSTFDGNTATTSGAAIYATGTPVVEVTSCTMRGGTATVDGGAIRVTNGGSVFLADLWIEGNTAGDDGGGIDVDATPLVELRRSFFCGNTAADEGGGFVARDADSTVIGNVLLANTARSGGGLFAAAGALETVNNHFVGNEATDSGAGVGSTGDHDSVNDLYAWNDGALAHENGYASLSYDLFFGNTDGDTDAYFLGAGLLYTDPLLGAVPPFACDAVALEPGVGSPLVDAGDPATSDVDGSTADIGAFGGDDPYPSSTSDTDGDGAVALVDCDDGDPAVFPGAVEQCNGQDDDCDGVVPLTETDVDADGWPACFGDCDDQLPGVHPGGVEIGCNTLDDDCDAQTLDQGDGDGDGVDVCSGDCDDADPHVGPGVTEIPADEIDEDCDGGELCHPDTDHDGVGESGLVDSTDSDCQDVGEARAVGDVCPGADDEVDPDDDGVPSGCDPCPLDARDDSDGDGVCDHVDACPGAQDETCDPGATDADEDGDGVPDAVDPFPDDDGGGGLQAPPAPPGGCGCASSSSLGSIAGAWLLCAIVGRRRSVRRSGRIRPG